MLACMHVHPFMFLSLYVVYVIAPDGALACRRSRRGRSWWCVFNNTRDLQPARARIPTQHSTVHLLNHLKPQPHFTLSSRARHTSASLLPITVYPSGSNDLGEPEA
jgi:hypothetical protein